MVVPRGKHTGPLPAPTMPLAAISGILLLLLVIDVQSAQYLNYCELTGDRAVQFLDGGAFQFRGRRIYEAVINSLLAQHGLVCIWQHQPGAHI